MQALLKSRSLMVRNMLKVRNLSEVTKSAAPAEGNGLAGTGAWHPADRAAMPRSNPMEGMMLAGVLGGTCFISCVPMFQWMLSSDPAGDH